MVMLRTACHASNMECPWKHDEQTPACQLIDGLSNAAHVLSAEHVQIIALRYEVSRTAEELEAALAEALAPLPLAAASRNHQEHSSATLS